MPKAPERHARPQVGSPKRHEVVKKHRAKEHRAHSRARGYSRRWERFRLAFLSEHPLCEFCEAQGKIVPATVCDHDIPHEHDPDVFWDNTFTALCDSCHSGDKQRMERRYSGEALLVAIAAKKRHTAM